MAITKQSMTDEQRKSVALEYLKRLDKGEDIFELFADDTQVYFPKWGLANGLDEVRQLFSDVATILRSIRHDYAYFNYLFQGDQVIVEGTSSGTLANGGQWQMGRWCDAFEIRDFKIQRLFIYLDPDYEGADTSRYPWLHKSND